MTDPMRRTSGCKLQACLLLPTRRMRRGRGGGGRGTGRGGGAGGKDLKR